MVYIELISSQSYLCVNISMVYNESRASLIFVNISIVLSLCYHVNGIIIEATEDKIKYSAKYLHKGTGGKIQLFYNTKKHLYVHIN